jgi:hypothetical protein
LIIVRMARGVTDHFPARRAEWVLSAMLFGWGIVLAPTSTDVFSTSHSFDGLAALAPEWVWAWICFSIGLIRLLALLINGTFADTWYGQRSPHVRGSLALLSCFIWTMISIGIYNSEISTTGLVVYPGLLFLEFTNVKEAWQDAGAVGRSKADALN